MTNKKVLLVSTFQEGAYAHIVAKAFNQLGFTLFGFDQRALMAKGAPRKEIDDRFEQACKTYEPDIIFAIKGRGISPQVIKDQSAHKVVWWLDNASRFADFHDYIDAYDKYYVIEASQGHPWMAIGIDPEIHKPIPHRISDLRSDVCFIGTAHPKRSKRVIDILQHLPFDAKIWGNSWNINEPDVASLWKGGAIYFDNLYRAYTTTKLILNVHYYPGITPNMRTIEAPASGTPMLSDTGEGIDECLVAGVEYIPYEGTQEARYLIRKYMEEPEARKEIGEAGRRRILKDHLLTDKLMKMIS